MIVPIDDVLTLATNEITGVKFIPISNVIITNLTGKSDIVWDKGKVIPKEKISLLKENGVKAIDLYFTQHILEFLCSYCPESYRAPSSIKSFMEIDKIVNTFRSLNRLSNRKRYITFVNEIYEKHDDFEPVIRFNEKIDYEKWNSIKRRLKKDIKLPILYSEIGVIIFVDLSREGENYINNFKKNADLCTLLTQRKSDFSDFKISPEFNRLTDVWAINEPEKLLDAYMSKNAKLIIVGDKIDNVYKSALLKVKEFDKFARFIVVTDINPHDLRSLLVKIKNAYNANNYTIE